MKNKFEFSANLLVDNESESFDYSSDLCPRPSRLRAAVLECIAHILMRSGLATEYWRPRNCFSRVAARNPRLPTAIARMSIDWELS